MPDHNACPERCGSIHVCFHSLFQRLAAYRILLYFGEVYVHSVRVLQQCGSPIIEEGTTPFTVFHRQTVSGVLWIKQLLAAFAVILS